MKLGTVGRDVLESFRYQFINGFFSTLSSLSSVTPTDAGGIVTPSSPNLSNLPSQPSNPDHFDTTTNHVSTDMAFDFERMTVNFEQIHYSYQKQSTSLPCTDQFLQAMSEITRLFETLGSAFIFVKNDIDQKIDIIRNFQKQDPLHYNHLETAVEYELNTKDLLNPSENEPPSCARTLYRLMWALKFADYLLEGLSQTFDPQSKLSKSDRTFKWAVARAYNEALAEHHSWTIRRTVRAACYLLPSKETFMKKININVHDRELYLERLVSSMGPLTKRMYTFYEKHGLLDIP